MKGGELPSDETMVQRWQGPNEENISLNAWRKSSKKIKEVLRKLGKLWLPVYIQWNCVHQNITLRGHRDSVKIDLELEKSGLNDFGNLVELLW